MHAREKDVLVPVIVVIADRHSGVVPGPSQPRLLGHIDKVPLAVVLKQPVGIFWGILRKSFDIGAIGKKNIQLAVVVVIEDGNAASHSLGRMMLRSFIRIQLEIDWLVRKSNRGISRTWLWCGRGGLRTHHQRRARNEKED